MPTCFLCVPVSLIVCVRVCVCVCVCVCQDRPKPMAYVRKQLLREQVRLCLFHFVYAYLCVRMYLRVLYV